MAAPGVRTTVQKRPKLSRMAGDQLIERNIKGQHNAGERNATDDHKSRRATDGACRAIQRSRKPIRPPPSADLFLGAGAVAEAENSRRISSEVSTIPVPATLIRALQPHIFAPLLGRDRKAKQAKRNRNNQRGLGKQAGDPRASLRQTALYLEVRRKQQ